MQFKNNSDLHLTYCTNIHPGESWKEVREQLEKHLPELKSRISPDQSFGVGLRLSARAAEELLEENRLPQFKEWLSEHGLYVFTMNGFPYGSFHRQRVKDLVYAPDWRTGERLKYTRNLIRILAELLPEGMEGGISTSPVSYKRWLTQRSLRKKAFRKGSENLARIAYELAVLKEEENKDIHLDIEPEPDCLLENSSDTISFYKNHLFPKGSALIAGKFETGFKEAKDMIRDHIRVCYDTCHFAVEYEDPAEAIESFREAGIRIGKTQVSAALKVQLNQSDVTRRQIGERLSKYDEPVYLHQVIEQQTGGGRHQYRDLPEALPAINKKEAEEWRIHFHVPLFVDKFDFMQSTRDDIVTSLEILIAETDCRHFEIETYTWEVLPDNLKVDMTSSIEREFEWVLGVLE